MTNSAVTLTVTRTDSTSPWDASDDVYIDWLALPAGLDLRGDDVSEYISSGVYRAAGESFSVKVRFWNFRESYKSTKSDPNLGAILYWRLHHSADTCQERKSKCKFLTKKYISLKITASVTHDQREERHTCERVVT